MRGAQADLAATVGGPDPGPLHRHAPAAERHLALLDAVTHRGAVGIVASLRTDDLVDLLGHQLLQHPEADPDTQGEQALLRGADQLAQRLLHPRRQRHLAELVGLVLYGPHSGPPSSSMVLFALATLAARADEAGGPPPTKFYELRDNLA